MDYFDGLAEDMIEYYSALIDRIKSNVPKTSLEQDRFLQELKTIIEEDDSIVSFKNKIHVLHILAMYCGSYHVPISRIYQVQKD